MARVTTRAQKRLLLAAVVLIGGWLAQQAGLDVASLLSGGEVVSPRARGEAPPSPVGSRQAPAESQRAVARIERAMAERESGFMVTVDARVGKLLRDDVDGSRHQRFVIELEGGHTLLVAHNIDLADRADVEVGDRVRVRGQYEWNERGGVLHWTHHDPDGDHPGGFIESRGRRVE